MSIPPPAEGSTVKQYAETLIMFTARLDVDGRRIGLDYGLIREVILLAFPVIPTHGPHYGHVTKLSFKELQNISGDLSAGGTRIPHRPRRRSHAPVVGTMELQERADQFRQRRPGPGFKRGEHDRAVRRAYDQKRAAANIALGLRTTGLPRLRNRPKTADELRAYLRNFMRIRRAANISRGLRSDGKPRRRRRPSSEAERLEWRRLRDNARMARKRASFKAAGLRSDGQEMACRIDTSRQRAPDAALPDQSGAK